MKQSLVSLSSLSSLKSLRRVFAACAVMMFAFTTEARSITSVTAAEDGDSITVAYDAKGDGEADTALYVAWGEEDAGDAIANWPNVRRVALLGADAGSTNFEFPAEVQASDASLVVRAFLATTTAPYDHLLDYIHGTGTQYLDTGFTVSPASCATIDASYEATYSQMRVFGTRTDNYADTFTFDVYVNGSGYWASALRDGSGDWVTSGLKPVLNTRYVFKLDGPNKVLYINGVQKGSHSGSMTKTSAGTLTVFAGRYFSGSTCTIDRYSKAANLYSFSLTSNDVAQCTWKPCVLAGRAGVYDEVSNTIVYSASGTDFEVGGATNVSTSVVSGDTQSAASTSVAVRTASVAVLTGLDGIGGDTLSVTGRVESLNGKASCTVKILVGESEESMTEWPGASKTLNETGDFTVTLAPSDLASGGSASALKPGQTYYVCVAATLADETKVYQSASRTVTMADEAKWNTAKATTDRNTLTVTGSLADVGMTGSATVEFWFGTSASDIAKVEEKVVTGTETFTFTKEIDFETAYVWQLRATNTSAGGTASTTVKSSENPTSITAPDATTYTWTGNTEISAGLWSDSSNWSADQEICLGYPQSANATAVFAAGTTNVVALDAARSIKLLQLGAAANVTFVQATSGTNTNDTKLTATDLSLNVANAALTLDGVALRDNRSGMATVRTLGSNFTLTLQNGADFYAATEAFEYLAGGKFTLKGGSTFSAYSFRCGCDVEIDDASFTARRYCVFGVEGTKSGTVVANWRFVGKSPRCFVDYDFSAEKSGAPTANFEFLVPEGGYDSAPIYSTNPSFPFGAYKGQYTNATFNMIVSADSPAKKACQKFTTTLVSWPSKGICKSTVVWAPQVKYDELVWGDEVSDGYYLTLGAKLSNGPGLLLIIR